MFAFNSTPLRVLQLSDPHLFATPDGRLLGITTRTSFEAVLALATATPAAALILTGDLVHDNSAVSYAALSNRLAAVDCPTHCLAGNHDHPELLATHFGVAAIAPVQQVRLPLWKLLLLNSQVADHNHGRIQRKQLTELTQLLTEDTTPTLIFLHHQPLPIHSRWLDTLAVDNGEELLQLCDQHPQVKAVIFGHVHQEFAAMRGGYQLLGAPATCVQFLPGSQHFAVDDQHLPGYRELLLNADGTLTSRVIRLAHYHELPLMKSKGY
ncbi:metallophosphoesterase [Chromatium okenii]|uniref:Phosphoesterase n=1 Tax=Chromatium okenii TaxID=61644 RepID=A0A2S7XNM3_9GAMM|nr:metallophosphoesterase [Chromatium okenii]MBV5309896.1 metallophosphoesterase [Chromatium okenii]PQJ94981.1 phosphoesterase [Chromatium okenii]